ncbi:flagellar hook-associated protein FlgL [Tepidimonas charontis]|uniref:Flagellar hook-associated protein 3 n=1 Tax=Tepidimonas charontis TaxID=2267262 RepID=A0A554XG21_9BURK|nr:flagellar hook-associated protein FlgL [Tepidimonas charontis]TSE34786.1 Flagellar hook-associated protein 3 [Tepidimonas charontis]
MTVFRVATANTFDRTIDRLQQRQAELAQQQERLSSGKRVQRISDDPAAAALAERERARLQRVQSDQRALQASRRNLELAESTLGTVNDLLHRAKELLVQGGNGALNGSDRRSIASELAGIRERLLALANTTDTAGRPLFAGLGLNGASAQPFVETLTSPASTTYGPDGRTVQKNQLRGQEAATETSLPSLVDGYRIFAGRLPEGSAAIASAGAGNTGTVVPIQAVILDPNVAYTSPTPFPLDDAQVPGNYVLTFNAGSWSVTAGVDGNGNSISPLPAVTATTVGDETQLDFAGLRVKLRGTPANGDTVRVDAVSDLDIWEMFDRAIGALNNESGHDLTQELAAVHGNLGQRLDRILSARAMLGDWLNRADQMDVAFQARENYHVEQESRLTDLDMLEAISRFQTLQLGYQAGLSSYAQVQRQSLFQYLA